MDIILFVLLIFTNNICAQWYRYCKICMRLSNPFPLASTSIGSSHFDCDYFGKELWLPWLVKLVGINLAVLNTHNALSLNFEDHSAFGSLSTHTPAIKFMALCAQLHWGCLEWVYVYVCSYHPSLLFKWICGMLKKLYSRHHHIVNYWFVGYQGV